MGDIVNFFSGYGAYHHNIVNKWIHILCVPIILYTINGFGEFCQIGNDFETEKFRSCLHMNSTFTPWLPLLHRLTRFMKVTYN